MDWGDFLTDINYWSVLAATVSTFVVGMIWYAWGMFGKRWAHLVGIKKSDMEKPDGMEKTFFLTAVGSFVAAAVLAALMLATNTTSAVDGAAFGFIVGIGLRLTAHVMHNGFAKRAHELTLIDGVHDAVQLAVMGAIIGGIGF